MGKISRDRGALFEREVANFFKDWAYDAYRSAQHKGKTGLASDVEGVPGIHLEAKRRRNIAVYEWMHQARDEAEAEGKGNIPVVFCRGDNEKMLVIMEASDWIELYREWEAGRVN